MIANKFYKTFSQEQDKHEYGLLQLDDKQMRGSSIAFLYPDRPTIGGRPYYPDTTQQDYDEKFVELLLDIYPVYKVSDVLTYHYDNYVNNVEEEADFIIHIEYVILPKVANYSKAAPLYKIIQSWVDQNKKIMLRKQLEEKNQFLQKAYEVAHEHYPSSPLSVDINPIELGKLLGYSESTTKRIMNELVAEGYVTSTLGMKSLLVTKYGLKYLREMDADKNDIPKINLTVGNNSNVQFQQGNTGSSQTMKIESNEELSRLIFEVRSNLDEIKQYLSKEQADALVDDVNYLENNVNRATPNRTVLQTIKSNILDILKSVPANVIANIITNQLP